MADRVMEDRASELPERPVSVAPFPKRRSCRASRALERFRRLSHLPGEPPPVKSCSSFFNTHSHLKPLRKATVKGTKSSWV